MRRSGSVLFYTIITMLALCFIASLAVDWGHVQLAKIQLQNATDAAARYAAAGMRSTELGTSGAIANAQSVMSANTVDGQAAPFNSATDLQLGTWNAATRTFTPATVAAGANAVKLTTRLVLGASGHPLSFISMVGKTMTVTATAIAVVNGQDMSTYVAATGNPWLSGMPSGTVSTDFRTSSAEWDTAGSAPNTGCSPAQVSLSSLGINAGASMVFDGVTGSANFGGNASTADGDSTKPVNLGSPAFGDYSYYTSPMNGISNCHAPINAMVAVFLDDNDPSKTSAPSPLDFSTDVSRDFTSLSPALKQVFFVGDGHRADGEVQQFVVPKNATRLFIANIDGWQYNNNTGGYNLTIHAVQTVSTVYLH